MRVRPPSVRARRVRDVDARWDAAQGATIRPGDWVLVEVEDTGFGMDETTRARVFEPFFSTKELEKGTGLGLATVHSIISKLGGHIGVQSSPGHGTCFSIRLPSADPNVEGSSSALKRSGKISHT